MQGLPRNTDAENCYLGSILWDNTVLDRFNTISPQDFYGQFSLNRRLYEKMISLHAQGIAIDPVTVSDEDHELAQYATKLMSETPTAAHAEYYANIVRENGIRRQVVAACTRGVRDAHDYSVPAEELVTSIEDRIAAARRIVTPQAMGIDEVMGSYWEEVEAIRANPSSRVRITTGLRDLDKILYGFEKGQYILVGARPGFGKTSLLLQIALHAALRQSRHVAIFSLEMSKEEIAGRFLAMESGIDQERFVAPDRTDRETKRILNAKERITKTACIHIDDSGASTVHDILGKAREVKRRHGLDLLIIDYLQLMEGEGANRNDELARINRQLKLASKPAQLDIPVIAASQLSRRVEDRAEKVPILSDLRDCLPGNALVPCAVTGELLPISHIVAHNLHPLVWALDESWHLVARRVKHSWYAGKKTLYRVTTRGGRELRCTAGHRLFTVDGWRKLESLSPGDMVALPRRCWANSDLLWDQITSIKEDGVEDTYDLTVEGLHNFCVDGFVTHNSGTSEQDADKVIFINQPFFYATPEQERRSREKHGFAPEISPAQLIVAKHRNGPTGKVTVLFNGPLTLFCDWARGEQ